MVYRNEHFNCNESECKKFEVYDLQQAQKIVDMPDAIVRLEEKFEKQDEKLDKLLKLFSNEVIKIG
jgi:hypothetical protein